MHSIEQIPSLLTIYKAITISTMADAETLISTQADLPERFIVIAKEQTGGIGRNQNKWLSPEGGLWFTYCFREEVNSHQITLLLGYCLHRILTESYPILFDKLWIKWPNDILIDNYKLSGTLVHSHKGYILIGIGVNTNNAIQQLGTFFEPISLKQIHGFEISGTSILKRFLAEFNSVYPTFTRNGINSYKDYINNHLYGLGKEITFDTGNRTITSICQGISEDGGLLLCSEDGTAKPYYSGSILSIEN